MKATATALTIQIPLRTFPAHTNQPACCEEPRCIVGMFSKAPAVTILKRLPHGSAAALNDVLYRKKKHCVIVKMQQQAVTADM